MTPEEALAKAKEIAPWDVQFGLQAEPYHAHWDLENLLMEVLRECGHDELADYYEKVRVDFWYE